MNVLSYERELILPKRIDIHNICRYQSNNEWENMKKHYNIKLYSEKSIKESIEIMKQYIIENNIGDIIHNMIQENLDASNLLDENSTIVFMDVSQIYNILVNIDLPLDKRNINRLEITEQLVKEYIESNKQISLFRYCKTSFYHNIDHTIILIEVHKLEKKTKSARF